MAISNYGDLRRALVAEGLEWTVDPRLSDTDPIRRFPLGAEPTQIVAANPAQRLDIVALLRATPPGNALLRNELVSRGVLDRSLLLTGSPGAMAGGGGGGGGPQRPAQVDWRSRFGWPWITTIRDQDPCEHCWVYAATALVESMVRIEHCVWSPRSVGDYIEATRTPCGQCGNPGAVLDWVAKNGQSDLDTVPWADRDPGVRTSSYWVPPPDKCGGGSMHPPPAYAPPGTRTGRTTRIPAYTTLGNTDDQKNWIDTVGPLVVSFDVYNDFYGWSGAKPYKKSAAAKKDGSHVVLAVGYDDTLQCWIIKNSWGPGWGNQGFGLIGYGECQIDGNAKLGLRLVNPDPFTKRNLHGGGMMESGDGALHRNFELIAPSAGNSLTHWWRDNSGNAMPWAKAATFGNDAADTPVFTGTSFNRNFEMIYRTTANRLHHRFFDQSASAWKDGPMFGPANAHGCVGFTESSWGPGNFEVVVATGDAIEHWWRNGAFVWAHSVTFGSGIDSAGPSLIQSDYGSLELVALLKTGQMQHWWRNGSNWVADQVFGSGLKVPPCMIQGEYGKANDTGHGNFELCVATPAGTIQHWWRNNQSNAFPWSQGPTFGAGVARVIALMESSFGFNLELVALRTDGMLQHYWRDGAGWHAGVVIGTTH